MKAILMGIVEGITEWLPISSTGHMILLERLVHFHMTEEFMSMFRVVIQLGAVLAVLFIFIRELWPFTPNKSSHYIRPPVLKLWLRIAVACLPAAVLGFLLDDWLDAHLYHDRVVAAMLILYGVLFLLVDRERKPAVTEMNQLSCRHALIIGLWQALALVPGTSRSGASITGALLLGISRPLAAQFTFYLAVPVMFGASGLKLIKYYAGGAVPGCTEILVLLAGTLSAFAVSLLSVRFLMNYVKKHSFRVFGWYRIGLGILVLLAGSLFLPSV